MCTIIAAETSGCPDNWIISAAAALQPALIRSLFRLFNAFPKFKNIKQRVISGCKEQQDCVSTGCWFFLTARQLLPQNILLLPAVFTSPLILCISQNKTPAMHLQHKLCAE
eukprot:518495-Pelagomonas_calceolata.AAC.3